LIGEMFSSGFAWVMWASVLKMVELIERLLKAYQRFCTIPVLTLFAGRIIVTGVVGATLPKAILQLLF
jgi:hypothetical protein